MSDGFTKLSNDILTSSVWSESNSTRILWITFLAASNATGYVSGSVPGMAQMARLTIPETKEALSVLLAPDEYSRTKEYEGRRVIEVDGGWQIVNYLKYRKRRDPEKRRKQNREAQQRYRDVSKKDTKPCKQEVSQSKPRSAQAEAEADKGYIITFHETSNEYRLANLLLKMILTRKSDLKTPDLQKWSKEIDLMIRRDKRSPDTIEEVIRWCQGDNFWKNNILSTKKLRKHFDTLELKKNDEKKPTSQTGSDAGRTKSPFVR